MIRVHSRAHDSGMSLIAGQKSQLMPGFTSKPSISGNPACSLALLPALHIS